jgi:hypothetical protein
VRAQYEHLRIGLRGRPADLVDGIPVNGETGRRDTFPARSLYRRVDDLLRRFRALLEVVGTQRKRCVAEAGIRKLPRRDDDERSAESPRELDRLGRRGFRRRRTVGCQQDGFHDLTPLSITGAVSAVLERSASDRAPIRVRRTTDAGFRAAFPRLSSAAARM